MNAYHYFITGFKLLRQPGLQRYVWVPLIVNTCLFMLMLWIGVHYFEQFADYLEQMLPNWLHWLNWLLWLFFAIAVFIVATYTFTLIANLLAAPFNGLLAEKVVMLLTHQPPKPFKLMVFVKDVPRMIGRQFRIIFYYLWRAVLLLLLFFIPGLHFVASPLWFVFNSWMMSMQYMDYPMDNERISFHEMCQQLRDQRWSQLGFGMLFMLAALIPVVNFLVMPAAVCGASAFYVDKYYRQS